jgi:hypothetical protein
MRMAIAASVALFACGCADGESELEPRTPVNAQLADHTRMRAPDIEDGFPRVYAMSEQAEPRPRPSHSVSLGYIGDTPLGTEPTPPHHEPYWARPFPCHWTHTCAMVPYYFPRVVGAYAVPPVMAGD